MPPGQSGHRCFPEVYATDIDKHIQYMQAFVSNYQAGASGRPIPPPTPSQASTGNENVSPNASVPEHNEKQAHLDYETMTSKANLY